MICPGCSTQLVCGCPACIALPHYHGKPRFFRAMDNDLTCGLCGHRASSDEWMAYNAMGALITTDEPTELTMLGFEQGTER